MSDRLRRVYVISPPKLEAFEAGFFMLVALFFEEGEQVYYKSDNRNGEHCFFVIRHRQPPSS